MEQFYKFFADTFPHLFGFVGSAIPALADAAEIVRYVVLIAGLALAAFAVVILVLGCFRIRFFRRLARVLLVIETLGAVGLGLIAANTVKTGDVPADMVKSLEIGSPDVFGLIRRIFADFGVKIVPSFIIIIVLFVVISVLLHLLILLSRLIVKRFEKEERDPDEPEALPEEESVAEPAIAAAPTPVAATVAPAEEPIVPADVPEAEMETVIESDDAPAAAEEPADEATEKQLDEGTSEEKDEEKAEEEPSVGYAPVPDYPTLDTPVFMPVPSLVSETVDFTDPKRDGYVPNPGVYADAAEKLISDEAAEDLTVVVYRKINGKIAELPIDALNANFKPYSYIDAKILRQKGLIPESAAEVKITSYGKIDKPLMVQASGFAPGVVKMIILAGGRPIQVL